MSQVLTDGNDDVAALDFHVYALDGNDRVISVVGSQLYGGDGHDFLGHQGPAGVSGYGGYQNDVVHGRANLGFGDFLYGGEGNDLLVGGLFNYDTAFATGSILPFNNEVSGLDYLDGGDGKDSLWGFDDDDVLLGGNGDDTAVDGVPIDGLLGFG